MVSVVCVSSSLAFSDAMAAGLFNLERGHGLAQRAQVLVDIGGERDFGQLLLPFELELGGLVDGGEVVLHVVQRKPHQPALGFVVCRGRLGLECALQFGLALGKRFMTLLDAGVVDGRNHAERRDLHVLQLGHQGDGLGGAGHHALCDRFHVDGARASLENGESSNEAQCHEGHEHEKDDALANIHSVLLQ